jgi:hypothetical protein
MKAIDYPVIGKYLRKKIQPGECYDFWEYYCTGFKLPCRDLTNEDLTKSKKNKVKKVMAEMLTSKRNHLLIKITGWPRITFLRGIFGDAKIIYILRDGRAVANSLINVDWWWGWQGPQNWRWGELSASQKDEWEKHDKSFLALAAIEWKILMDAWEKAKEITDHKDILEIKYENFCSDPVDVLKSAIEFCYLEWSDKFKRSINNKIKNLKSTNFKWQQDLSEKQRSILDEVIGLHLKKYGYS